ncbi:MAG TPA: DUF2269 family protein [Polyangiales bacterium]|nr:DUF2269 family protein [Polyangiales bacterium]
MTAYRICVFLHLLGVFGLFGAFGLEAGALVSFARARTREQADQAVALLRMNRLVGPPTLLLLLLPGGYMAHAAWSLQQPWIALSLLSLIAVALLGALVSGRNVARLAHSSLDAPSIETHAIERRLRASLLLRMSLILGAAFLMVVKPDFTASCVALAAAISGGLLSGRAPLDRAVVR